MKQMTIETEAFLRDSLFILRETFEGSPEGAASAYLDRGTGVFSTLDQIDSESASSDVNGSSVAAHTEHLKFYIDRALEFMEGSTEQVNWEQSWLIETVNEEEWDYLREAVRRTYREFIEKAAATEEWDTQQIGGMISIIAHTAYHLGAIRQIAKSLSSSV